MINIQLKLPFYAASLGKLRIEHRASHMVVNEQPPVQTFLTQGEQITLCKEPLKGFSLCFQGIDTAYKCM